MDEDFGLLGAVREGDAFYVNGVLQVAVGRAGHEHGAGPAHVPECHKGGVWREKEDKASHGGLEKAKKSLSSLEMDDLRSNSSLSLFSLSRLG